MSDEDEQIVAAVVSGRVDSLEAAKEALARHQADLAAACIDAGLAESSARPDLLRFAAGFLNERGRADEADALILRLGEVEALSAEEHALVGLHSLEHGESETAAAHLRDAIQLKPENAGYRFLWSTAMNRVGRHREVLAFQVSRVRDQTASADECRECISAALLDQRPGLALLLAVAAVRAFPNEPGFVDTVAFIHLGDARYADVLRILEPDRTQSLATLSSERLFLLSVAFAMARRYQDALPPIEQARSVAPDNTTYLRHAIAVVGTLGRYQDAAGLYDVLLALETPDEATLRAAFAAYSEAGRYEQAIVVGAKLVQARPDDLVFSSVYQAVLGKHLYAQLLRNAVQPSAAGAAQPSVQKPASADERSGKLALASRTVGALFLREMKTRFGKARLGYLWVIFEPLAQISVMITIITFLNHAGRPPIGPNFAVFYFTGILPFHMFTNTAARLMSAAPENRPLLQIPRVQLPDIFMARALLEGLTEMIVAVVLILLFLAFGLDALPINPVGVVGALLILWVGAVGLGMINAVIATYFVGWERVWGALTSLLYFSSGTFFIPRMMPVWVRDYLMWNPVLQGIELVRVNYFHEPPPEWLEFGYLAGLSLVLLAVGLSLERLCRQRMLEVE